MNRCQFESLELRTLLNSSLVADYNGVFPADAVNIDGISYFTADEGLHGYELWRSDGTIAGTTLVKDLIAGKADSQITLAGELDGALLFFSRLDDGMISLWQSDGSSAGTSKLADIGHQDSRAILLREIVNDHLVFVIHGGPVDQQVTLWSSDGTGAGTSVIQTLLSGEDGDDYNHVLKWYVTNDRIVLPAQGNQLWSTDGTVGGTIDLGTIIVGDDEHVYISDSNTAMLNDEVFVASESAWEGVLWKTNGTVGGTVIVKRFQNGGTVRRLIVVNDRILFQLSGPNADQRQLWRTDGTEAGTAVFMSIDGYLGSAPIQLSDAAVFLAHRYVNNDRRFPIEVSLWRSDATAEGTHVIKTFLVNTQNGVWSMDSSVVINGFGYFMLQTSVDQPFVKDRRQLWRTDGTAAGTVMVEDLSRYKRTDLEERMRQLNENGGIPTVLSDEDRDSVQIGLSDGRIAVKTPGDTLVFDPSTMTAPIGPAHGYARLESDGTLRIFGTLNADNIRVYRAPGDPTRLVVKLNGVNQTFDIDDVARVRIYGYGGDDQICVLEKYGTINKRLAVWGGDGNDLVYGGVGRDSIWGENGNDTINSGKGDDTLAGGSGDDTVIGSHGTDVVSGGGGDDCIDGGFGTDVIFGEQVFEIFYNGKQGQDRNDIVELVLN